MQTSPARCMQICWMPAIQHLLISLWHTLALWLPIRSTPMDRIHLRGKNQTSPGMHVWGVLAGLEKSAAIRPFATKKSRLASEKILLADSLATESYRLADRLATKLFSKRTTPMRTERDRARSLADVFVGPRCNGSWPFGPVDRVCE